MKQGNILKKKETYLKLFRMAVAFALSGYLFYLGYQNVEAETANQSFPIVALGDSIIGKERDGSAVHAYFEEYTGVPMLNAAFGGNLAGAGENADRYSHHEESLNLYALAEAICYRDFGVQKADMAASQIKGWYFWEALGGLESADLEQTDILLLEFGVNDYMMGKKLDNPEDALDVNTYGGALRYAIELFQKTYPDLDIVLVTPAFCHIVDYGMCTEVDFGGGTLDAYADLGKEIAAEYGLDVIDVFYKFGLDQTNVMVYTEDGMHLSVEGRQMYAHFLQEQLREKLKLL